MLRALMDKADSMQKQMDNVSRKMEILRKNQNNMLEIKSTEKEVKNAFDGLISRLDIAEERIAELKEMLIEHFQNGKAKRKKNQSRISKNCETTTKGVTYE